jgi:hypothetical protein
MELVYLFEPFIAINPLVIVIKEYDQYFGLPKNKKILLNNYKAYSFYQIALKG